MRKLAGIVAGWLAVSSISAGESSDHWVSEQQSVMGTVVRIEIGLDDPERGRRIIQRAMNEFRRIDRMMSPMRESSDLARINREAAKGWVSVPGELLQLIARANEVSVMTAGKFDITFASVGRFYDYRRHRRPGEQTIRQYLPAINFRHIELDLDRKRLRFRRQGVTIDLGGIAKGYAVDLATAILVEEGVVRGIVTAGGDSRILGDRHGRPWQVGVRDPRNDAAVAAVLPVINEAVSTSGDYERYFEADGVRYHHILNPRTGRAASGIRSVTILGPDATTTDALSTSVFVMGVKPGLALVESLPGIETVIIDDVGRLWMSAGLGRQTEDKSARTGHPGPTVHRNQQVGK